MAYITLPQLVAQVRLLLLDELGFAHDGLKAIGVNGQVKQAKDGMTCIIERVPKETRDSGPVVGGTYHGDLWCVNLVNPIVGDRNTTHPARMASAIRKMQNSFNCHEVMHVAEDLQSGDERPEQCLIKIFSPVIES